MSDGRGFWRELWEDNGPAGTSVRVVTSLLFIFGWPVAIYVVYNVGYALLFTVVTVGADLLGGHLPRFEVPLSALELRREFGTICLAPVLMVAVAFGAYGLALVGDLLWQALRPLWKGKEKE